MIMEPIFYEIFEALPRQGPGDDISTERALKSLTELPEHPDILDVGCGAGRPTIVLARLTTGRITALDSHPPFIEALKREIEKAGYSERIKCVVGDMASMSFEDGSFDLIWSEGAVFIIGFENALKSWKRLLRPDGYLVASDLVWFRENAPQEVRDFFARLDPNIKHYKQIFRMAESAGYKVVDYFPLPDKSWWTNYYTPLGIEIAEIKPAHLGDKGAQAVLDSLQLEIDMYRKYSEYYGYGFYIMQLRK